MNILKTMKSKKYITRIYLWITGVIFLIVLILSFSVYKNVEKTILVNEDTTSKKILYQIKYNIDFVDDVVRKLCLSTYNDNDIRKLMYLKGEESYEEMKTINKLNSSVITSFGFLHSIDIYNNIRKTYYSTYISFFNRDEKLEQFIKENGILIRLKPYVRDINSFNLQKNREKVISYFMYDMLDSKNNMDGAVIVNIKLDWLLNNIDMINALDKNNKEEIYIFDDKGQIISLLNDNEKQISDIIRLYKKDISGKATSENNSGFFSGSVNGTKYLMSYINIQSSGWTILKLQPYNTIYEYINRLKNGIIIITVILLALTLVLAYTVSKRLYKPIGKLINNVASAKANSINFTEAKDEFLYLQEVYKNNINQLEIYKKDKNSNRDILKNYFLRKLLFDSSYFKNNIESVDILKENNISLSFSNPLVICILKIDKYNEFENKLDNMDKYAFKNQIRNTVADIISSGFINESVDMEKDQIIFFINLNEKDKNFYDSIISLISQAQQSIKQNLNISVSVAVSEIVTDIGLLTASYNKVLENSMYRYIFGDMSLITPDKIQENLNNGKAMYEFGYENKFIEALKAGNLKQCGEELKDIKNEISKLDLNIVTISLMHFVINIMNTIFEMNRNRIEPIKIDLNKMGRQIFELETIDEFFSEVKKMINQIEDTGKISKKLKNDIIYETIKEIIDTNYHDINLCINSIATILKISPAKTSVIFEENMKMSIPNYINSVRLGKAVEWLENSNLSIEEIMHKIGIENESYFYKLFKSKYGTTPRNYISERTKKV